MESSVLLTAGVVCLIAAVVGGGLKAFGIQLPVLDSLRRQILLGILGLGLIAMAQFERASSSRDSARLQDSPSNDAAPANAIQEDSGGNEQASAPAAARAPPMPQALVVAWRSYDANLASINNLVENGLIRPGSPKAIRIAAILERAQNALNAATAAHRAGNSQGFTVAFSQVNDAFVELRPELESGGRR